MEARQRAREIAALLGFDNQEQIRLATATSEIARNAFRYATGGSVSFTLRVSDRQLFVISITDEGPGIAQLDLVLNGQYVSTTGLGKGISGTRRLMDHFEISTSPQGTRVETGKTLPASAARYNATRIRQLIARLKKSSDEDALTELERLNQDLLRTLSELREKQEILDQLNRELEDTNRGVVALYAELDQRATDLRRISDLKTSFLSNLSHEFRTPLNSIASLCRLLLGRADGALTSEQEKQVTYIQHSAGDLSELVNDLLDLTKVEAGKTDVKPRKFAVEDLFGALRGVLKPLLNDKNVDLLFEPGRNLPQLFTDEGKLSQILRNLVSNALKFTLKGSVTVTAAAGPNNHIVFRVQDTGIGIAREDLERIFEEFVQIENDVQGQVKGTGLGLPLSRRLAELLGGTLDVESIPGKGSTFTVKLPIYYNTAQDKAALREANSEATGGTILFIEDNRETIFIHESLLKDSNYRLVFAVDIGEARATIEHAAPSLIVLDRLLHNVDSLFYIGELREKGFAGPILVLSVVDDSHAALHAGATAFLAKPIEPFTLINTIHELVNKQLSRRILLVDDDEVTRYLLGGALSKMGFRVLEARNGRDALRVIRTTFPDVIFLDIVMSGLNGLEVLREIRSTPATQAIPVIIHSSKELEAEELKQIEGMKALVYPKRPIEDGTDAKLRQILDLAGVRQ
ncbi:ATP-binding protein [Silvibacterium acidisoli]|uniref:ATP-binding protein n=1 Tax=Acidobacteriaceae bacterium ZG23-2 TaxID=2883246 RepID=UPI00406BECDB